MPLRTPLVGAFLALALVVSACSSTPEDAASGPGSGTLPVAGPALRSDGIGDFSFGLDAAAVMEGISASIGGWDVDSAEDTAAVLLPECPSGEPRIVAWGSLVLVFVDRSGGDVFTSWSYGFDPLTGNSRDLRGLGLRTTAGIGLGSTRSELVAAYRDTVSIVDRPAVDSALFTIEEGTSPYLAGKLDAAGPTGVVDLLETLPTC